MRITVDLDDSVLESVREHTHIVKISPAINFVVEDWLKRKKREALVNSVLEDPPGYGYTNDELEAKLYDDAD